MILSLRVSVHLFLLCETNCQICLKETNFHACIKCRLFTNSKKFERMGDSNNCVTKTEDYIGQLNFNPTSESHSHCILYIILQQNIKTYICISHESNDNRCNKQI